MKRRNTTYDKQIGTRLRQLRVSRGLTLSKLGQDLGVTFQQVQKYENGSNAIASSHVPALCKALSITPDELYCVGVPSQPNATTLKVIQRLEKLSIQQRGVVNAVIEAFEEDNGNGRAA